MQQSLARKQSDIRIQKLYDSASNNNFFLKSKDYKYQSRASNSTQKVTQYETTLSTCLALKVKVSFK